MVNPSQKNRESKLLSYATIEAATLGNIDAVNDVLLHYSRYVNVLCTRTLYDENGDPHLCVDYEMRHRLESKLIMKILCFQADRVI